MTDYTIEESDVKMYSVNGCTFTDKNLAEEHVRNLKRQDKSKQANQKMFELLLTTELGKKVYKDFMTEYEDLDQADLDNMMKYDGQYGSSVLGDWLFEVCADEFVELEDLWHGLRWLFRNLGEDTVMEYFHEYEAD